MSTTRQCSSHVENIVFPSLYQTMKSYLDSIYYETNTIYIRAKTEKCPKMATEQQPVIVIIPINIENEYSKYMKLSSIPVYIKNFII